MRDVEIMLSTKLRIDDWAESVIEEFADGSKVTRAQVRLRDGADGLESGTGGLAGITGTCTSESTHADYPFMPLALSYRLP